MITTSGTFTMEDFASALQGTAIQEVRVPDGSALVRGVVIHASGDPAPDADVVVLCAGSPDEVPDCVALVVREPDLSEAVLRAGARTAVFTIPEDSRWSDVYDRIQWAVGESAAGPGEYDPFRLADTLATATGGAVTIEDAERRVVAFSAIPGQWIDDVRRQGILGRQVPEHSERDVWYGRLWRSSGVVEFPAGAESTARLAVAVRVGERPVGSIWVVGSHHTLNPDADKALESSTGLVAACLAHQDKFAARSREWRGQVLAHLLSPASGAGPALGYELPGPTVLIGIVRAGEPHDPELLDARLADLLSLQAQRCQGSGLAAVIDDRVYALLPAVERSPFDAQLRSTLSRAVLPVGQVAVSRVVHSVSELPTARRQVDNLQRLYHGGNGSDVQIVHAKDERDELWLTEISDAVREAEGMRAGVLTTILEHDRNHGTDYAATLRAWFDACGDIPAASERLHVHQNTFRYRLSRIGALFGVQLDDADQRLLLHLQLRMRDFA